MWAMRSVRERRSDLFDAPGSAREEKLRLLATASQVLASSFELAEPLRHVAQLAVARLADVVLIDLLGEKGDLSRVATAFAEAGLSERAVDDSDRARRPRAPETRVELGPSDPDRQERRRRVGAGQRRQRGPGGEVADAAAADVDQGTGRRADARLDEIGAALRGLRPGGGGGPGGCGSEPPSSGPSFTTRHARRCRRGRTSWRLFPTI